MIEGGNHPRRIRVGHLLGRASYGGIERSVVEFARSCNRDKVELSVCIIEGEGPIATELRALGVDTVVLGVTPERSRRRMALHTAWKYSRWAQSRHLQILHANVGGRLPRYFVQAMGTQVLMHVHAPPVADPESIPDGNVIRQKIAHAYLAGSDRFIACSPTLRLMLLQARPSLAGLISVIPEGVDLARFVPREPGSPEVARVRQDIGVLPSELTVGFVGRLAQQKGISYLLRAASRVLEQSPDVRFVFAGSGPVQTEIEAAQKLLHPGAVLMLGDRGDVPRIMRALDVLVVPSYWETPGIVNLEAMASGVPVVAFDVPDIPEVVIHGETGLLVPHGNVQELAQAILTLLNDAELRRRMGQAGRRRVEQHFDVRDMTRKIEELYEELLANSVPRRPSIVRSLLRQALRVTRLRPS